ncbi:hypothetical protein [Fulvimarina pelagi]|nr:hypothetical protein [Fulvimarina pelagi]
MADRLGGDPSQDDFASLLAAARPSAREELDLLLERADEAADIGDGLGARLFRSALTKACMKQRALGAPSNKIAHAQIHRALSRSILWTLSSLWLLRGLVPVGTADETVRLMERARDIRRPVAGFAPVGPGTAADLRAAITDISQSLLQISVSKATVAPSLRRSNCAIGVAAPFFLLRRHGAANCDVRAKLTRFMERAAPELADAIAWQPSPNTAVDEAARTPAPRPVRQSCCLKYTCGSRSFCGTCPKRE